MGDVVGMVTVRGQGLSTEPPPAGGTNVPAVITAIPHVPGLQNWTSFSKHPNGLPW